MEPQGRRRTVVLLCADTWDTNFLLAREHAEGKWLNISAVQCMGCASFGCVFCFSDPRTDPWPLVHSPLPVTLLFASYLFLVALGPFYMRQRKPLKLRGLLIAYNLAMMTLSSYMFYEVRRQDWLLGKHSGSVWKPETFQWLFPLMKGMGANLDTSMFCHRRSSIALLKVLSPKCTSFPPISQSFSHS